MEVEQEGGCCNFDKSTGWGEVDRRMDEAAAPRLSQAGRPRKQEKPGGTSCWDDSCWRKHTEMQYHSRQLILQIKVEIVQDYDCRGNAESSPWSCFPHCITDEGSPDFKEYNWCIWLQVFAVDFKWAAQLKWLDVKLQVPDHLRLRGCKFNSLLQFTHVSEVNYHTKCWSILAGSQHTPIFIHLSSVTVLLLPHSLLPLAPRSTHRVRSVGWGSCSVATLSLLSLSCMSIHPAQQPSTISLCAALVNHGSLSITPPMQRWGAGDWDLMELFSCLLFSHFGPHSYSSLHLPLSQSEFVLLSYS